MNAHDLQYGIEIETIAPDTAVRNDGLRIGSYHHGIQVPYLPAGWTAENNGSINNGHAGHKCEIVSPILKGPEGLAQVAEVARILESKGHRVNVSCGVHIHVGWQPTFSIQALARLIIITAYLEKGLYAVTGTTSREQSVYCGGVRPASRCRPAPTNCPDPQKSCVRRNGVILPKWGRTGLPSLR